MVNTKLAAMLRACGKTNGDLGRAVWPGTKAPAVSASKYSSGRTTPGYRVAASICAVLSEWAGREVPIDSIFTRLSYNDPCPDARRAVPRDDVAIAKILAGKE